MPLVVGNAMCMCAFGMAPSSLEILPISRVMAGGSPAANITNAVPFMNVMPFAMCTSMANPAVAAATAAALGVLTPMPCTPMTQAWMPGCPTVMLGGPPALDSSSMAICDFGGVINITFPGQVTVSIP